MVVISMQSGCSPWFIEKQMSDSGTGESSALLNTPCTEVKGFAKEAQTKIIFDAFNNAVDRLERLLDRETAMLIEHQPIALDDFNRKKRHGLLELSRAMDAMRGLHHDFHGHDPKVPLARLRVKLQKNLMILQTHLDAVGAIAAIIGRAIQDHESDGTYTPVLGNMSRPR
jgi:hypothetical protein